MSTLLPSLKFAWDYFVRGRHRSSSGGTSSVGDWRAKLDWHEDWRAKLDWHEDSLVGRYVRTTIGTWWTNTILNSLGYEVSLIAPGQGPTVAQMASFEALADRMPAIVAAADLQHIPKDDGWGNAPPPFDINTARIRSIGMAEDGSYYVNFENGSYGEYLLSPRFVISPNLNLISVNWSC